MKKVLDFKVLMLGGADVGITSLIEKHAEDFPAEYSFDIGIDFSTKKIELEETEINLALLELGSANTLEVVEKTLRKGPTGYMLVFDVSRTNSLEEVIEQYQKISDHLGKHPIVLVGNKADLIEERQIEKKKAEEVAKELGALYVETSVITGQNIEYVFEVMAEKIMESL